MSSNRVLNAEESSERNQKNELVNQKESNSNNNLIMVEENKNAQNNKEGINKGSFEIDAIELENLMGKYKERGKDFQDLKYFEKKSVPKLLSELNTAIATYNSNNSTEYSPVSEEETAQDLYSYDDYFFHTPNLYLQLRIEKKFLVQIRFFQSQSNIFVILFGKP